MLATPSPEPEPQRIGLGLADDQLWERRSLDRRSPLGPGRVDHLLRGLASGYRDDVGEQVEGIGRGATLPARRSTSGLALLRLLDATGGSTANCPSPRRRRPPLPKRYKNVRVGLTANAPGDEPGEQGQAEDVVRDTIARLRLKEERYRNDHRQMGGQRQRGRPVPVAEGPPTPQAPHEDDHDQKGSAIQHVGDVADARQADLAD